MMRPRVVALVARRDLLDLRRQRGVWVTLLLLPFVNVTFLLLLPGFLTHREQASLERTTYRVAVQGATTDDIAVAGLALSPDRGRFLLLPTPDARRAVLTKQADVGLRVEQADGQLKGEVFVLSTRTRSRAAFGAATSAIEAFGIEVATQRLAANGLPPAAARPLAIEPVDLTTSGRGQRLALSTILPLVVLLPLTGAVGIAAQRISGSKDQRVFEPLLVLPFTRREVLLGKAVSGLALGSITLPAVAGPLLLGRVVPISRAGTSISLPLAETVGVVAVAVVLLVLLVSLGVMVGSAARTSAELGSVLQMATLPIFLLGLFLQFRTGIVSRPAVLVLPFFGLLLIVRDIAVGALTFSHALIAGAATAVWATLLLVAGSRFVESERSVLRSTN
ncbi:MAG: sodium transport system permease protein [Actinomycetota bacterium]|jgi:ABC-type Na+ efflux pump permease subunit|nr:sodium transport system permease protein [Actinomycetota bacterium]